MIGTTSRNLWPQGAVETTTSGKLCRSRKLARGPGEQVAVRRLQAGVVHYGRRELARAGDGVVGPDQDAAAAVGVGPAPGPVVALDVERVVALTRRGVLVVVAFRADLA